MALCHTYTDATRDSLYLDRAELAPYPKNVAE